MRDTGSYATAGRSQQLDRRRVGALFALAIVLVPLSRHARAAENPADLVLVGGKIVTMDDSRPQAEDLVGGLFRSACMRRKSNESNRQREQGARPTPIGVLTSAASGV